MPLRHRGPPDEVRALDAWVKLARAAAAVGARVHRHLALDRLTVSQFGVLEALDHLGPLCQRDLGRKILASPANVTVVVRHLERRGLVARARSAANRKFVEVRLTPRGRALVRQVFPRHAGEVLAAMAALRPADQEALGRLCRRLGLAAAGTPPADPS